MFLTGNNRKARPNRLDLFGVVKAAAAVHRAVASGVSVEEIYRAAHRYRIYWTLIVNINFIIIQMIIMVHIRNLYGLYNLYNYAIEKYTFIQFTQFIQLCNKNYYYTFIHTC